MSSYVSVKAGVRARESVYPRGVGWVAALPEPGLFIKRFTDVVVSGIALAGLSPMLAVIAALVKLDSKGPALYCGARVGKNGRIFNCCKFRTMVPGADRLQEELRGRNERQAPCFKIADDPRITGIGGFLRRYSLDEVPQLWNVLKGEMSLVGPRPHPEADCRRYVPEHWRRLEVTPGMTGLWQVTARSDPSFEKNMQLDLQYIEHWSLWLDFRILCKTLPVVLRGNGS